MVFRSEKNDISSQLSGELDWKKKKDRTKNSIAMLKLITRYYKAYDLKTTSISKEQIRIPIKLKIGKFACRQKRTTV